MAEASLEKRALVVSIFGGAFMACLGVYFAIVAKSEAIMLDGVFSAVGFLMASLTLKVAGLVKRPDDEHFHYGYSHFAPLLNVLKALLMLVLCTLALLSAVDALFHGGRNMAMGSAVIYGSIATVGCLAIALYMRKAKKLTNSALVEVDAQGWAIDTVLSGAVLVAFVAGWAMQGTELDVYLPYLDPGMVAILCLLSLPIPLKILIENGREVLLFAPDPSWQQAVEACFEKAVPKFPTEDYRIRLLKMGNSLNVLVHVKPGPGFELSSLNQLDEIRTRFNTELETLEVKTVADVVFIADMKLAN
jgi:predicted Co/Zn/Cd cation transporter (cation efflux family)